MKIERLSIPNAVVITPDVYQDERGYFKETCNPYMNFHPVQANQSISSKHVVRGLHQQDNVAKLVWVAKGSIFDVVYDSETGNWEGVELTADNHKQLYVPPNMYHGFQALEDDTVVCYLMDGYYNSKEEHGLSPERVEWPLDKKIISAKDKSHEPEFHS